MKTRRGFLRSLAAALGVAVAAPLALVGMKRKPVDPEPARITRMTYAKTAGTPNWDTNWHWEVWDGERFVSADPPSDP